MMTMKGRVVSICISQYKGTKKKEVKSALIIADWGIEGDAHAGPWPRQVSLLSAEAIESIRPLIPDLKPGDFAENIVTQGTDLDWVKIGDRIFIGDEIVLEVSQIGKECHSGCRIQELTGKCIIPEKGIFTRVIKGGMVKKNATLEIRRNNFSD